MSERSRMWGGGPANRSAWPPVAPAVAAAHRMAAVGRPDRSPEPDRAEPTDGRHAFDRDAALTPIFTALRRGVRRRTRPAPPLRPSPEPVQRHRGAPGDPPTAPIPVVPALYAVDPYPTGGYPAADPYATGGHAAVVVEPPGYRGLEPRTAGGRAAWPVDPRPVDPRPVDPYGAPPVRRAAVDPPSRNEATAVWHLSDDPAAWSPVTDTGRHHRRLAPAGW